MSIVEEDITILVNKSRLADMSKKAKKQLIRGKGVTDGKLGTPEAGTKVITFQLIWSRKNVQFTSL